METVAELGSWLGMSGLSVRTLVLAFGIGLMLAGSRHYRLALVLPAAAFGAMLVDKGMPVNVSTGVRVTIGLVAALGTGLLAGVLETLAVRLAGCLLGGGVALAAWPALMGGGAAAPWWLPLAGGLAGLLLFPRLYRAVLRLAVPLLAGLLIAYAIGRPGHPMWVLGPAVIGVLLDAALLSRPREVDPSRT